MPWRRILTLLALLFAATLLSGPASATASTDYDCADFSTRDEAQQFLDADPSDPDRLDLDGDGYACEWGPDGIPDSNDDEGSGMRAKVGVPQLPWWAWTTGGIGLLWAAALIRVTRF